MSSILVNLAESPRFTYFESRPSETVLSELGLVDSKLGDWTGFYDWLRTDTGAIVGVRYWPFEKTEFLVRPAVASSDIVVDPRGALLVFFGREEHFDDKLSDDQAFEESRVLLFSGRHILLFGCSDLSAEERTQLSRACRHE
ncbi:MAG TPA: hypothetical protein VJU77_08980 [Chthoniobacterales bacterium]|nr:hypothetical protein [Chthoniobacterales bacterium]